MFSIWRILGTLCIFGDLFCIFGIYLQHLEFWGFWGFERDLVDFGDLFVIMGIFGGIFWDFLIF